MDFRMHISNIFDISSSKTNIFFSGYRSWIKALQLAGITFFLSACGGGNQATPVNQTSGNTSSTAIKALPDTASTNQDTAVSIPVLNNDTGIDTSAVSLTINQQPSNGSVKINSNKTITYTPKSSFSGTDSFSYKISQDTVLAITSVTITINCPTCTPDIKLSLSWQPSSIANDIGYLIYFGTSSSNVNSLAYDLSSSTGLNPSSPSVELSASNDLKLSPGDQVCFRIQAYNDVSVSDLSNTVCGYI